MQENRKRVTKPFTNWKKSVEKMKAHSKSAIHIQACQSSLLAERAIKEGSIIQQLHRVSDEEKRKNREAIKAFICCTHFLARQHIAHTTNFDKLVDLIVSCTTGKFSSPSWKLLEEMQRIHLR